MNCIKRLNLISGFHLVMDGNLVKLYDNSKKLGTFGNIMKLLKTK
jgi:hypothetical protein